jgi:N-acetyl sugar amidotransferase
MSQKVCSRCISDITMEEICFDNKGVCNFCHTHDTFIELHPNNKNQSELLDKIIVKLKSEGKNKEYDCIIGLSGGVDSTYLLYWAVQRGLRPLAVSFDNGWNTEIAVSNIRKATTKLGVDLHTIIADWEEMKELQRAFLEASVSDADAPTDYAIYSLFYREAIKFGVKYSLNGHSFRAEGSVPKSWSYFDGRYVKSVLRKFYPGRRIKSFPIMSMTSFIYYVIFRRIRDVRVFDYIPYDKEDARLIITRELDWVDYGGHHHENIFTRWFQSYYLPKKFNIDKRKVELSAQIRTGTISREQGLSIVEKTYPYLEDDVKYVTKKLGYSKPEMNAIMNAPTYSYQDYPTYIGLIKRFRVFIKIAASLNLVPRVLYEKYAKQ